MENFIQPVRLKLARAGKQRDSLLASAAEWLQKNPPKFQCEYLPDRLGYRLVLAPFPEPEPFEQLGLDLGEYTHNLRSALDNLAFALARLQVDPPAKPNDISFPIFSDAHTFSEKRKKYLRQLPDNAAALIESIQPYNRQVPDGQKLSRIDPLLILQYFNNMDKHRVPAVTLLAPQRVENSAEIEFRSDEEASANLPPDETYWIGPLTAGVALLEHRTKHPIASIKGDFKAQAVLSIVCDEETYEFHEIITKLHQYVSLVSDQFAQFFQQR
jgi:hypothetical protein